MDLNVKVLSAYSAPSPFLIQRIDSLDGVVFPMAQILSPLLRKCAREKVRLQGDVALLGLVNRYCQRCCRRLSDKTELVFDDLHLDAHDLYNSDLFDDSSSGIGGWGDPANDYQISTGGLKDIILAYPNPHHIRRNLTVLPFATSNYPAFVFPGDPLSPPSPRDMMANITMTKQNVDYTVNNFEGDFSGFQAWVEALPVSSTPPYVVRSKFTTSGSRPS